MRMRWRRGRRAVTPIIANILLLGMTVTAGALLFAFRPDLPQSPSSLYFSTYQGPGEPAWGDGSDCSNVNGVQQCKVLPSLDIILTASNPSSLLVSSLQIYFFCNGTIYLSATLNKVAWVPGSTGTVGTTGAPQLGKCGTYVPPKAGFNRLLYFHQLTAASAHMENGDTIVLYSATFVGGDDDFHGAPVWCFSTPGACTIDIVYGGPPQAALAQIPLYGLTQGG